MSEKQQRIHEETIMSQLDRHFAIKVESTENRCPVGETVGQRNMVEGRTPVLSCEGACIRGEIARLTANLVAKEDGYARACHGELLSVPDSARAALSGEQVFCG